MPGGEWKSCMLPTLVSTAAFSNAFVAMLSLRNGRKKMYSTSSSVIPPNSMSRVTEGT